MLLMLYISRLVSVFSTFACFLQADQPQLLTFTEQKSIANCRVKREVDVPVSVAYACYSDREAIPEWMPFISTVKPFPLWNHGMQDATLPLCCQDRLTALTRIPQFKLGNSELYIARQTRPVAMVLEVYGIWSKSRVLLAFSPLQIRKSIGDRLKVFPT
ncbi:hypothetical protein L195_g045625, partial [Trifolium pratense]